MSISSPRPLLIAMSDSRYPSHYAQQEHMYGTSSLTAGYQHSSARQAAHYGRDIQMQSNYPSQYSTNAYSLPMSGQPQSSYPQGVSRTRTPSVPSMQATSSGHYPHSQSPPMPSNSTHLHQMQTSPMNSAAQYASYSTGNPNAIQADYLRSSLSPPSPADYYYPSSSMQDLQGTTPSQRPFPCDMCALSFNRQHDLKRHRDTHSGERPFLCNGGCGKTFTRKDALKRHQLVKNCGRADE